MKYVVWGKVDNNIPECMLKCYGHVMRINTRRNKSLVSECADTISAGRQRKRTNANGK